MVIRAVSFKGRPVSGNISGQFGETGGTIGRGEGSTLVLPDAERYISRTQAAISFQAGGFVITDSGTKNPIVLNGRALGPGSQAKLSDGDQIKIGDYTLEVSLALRASVAPPVSAAPPVKDDPFAAFGGPSSRPEDPFADLLKPRSSGKEPQREPQVLPPWPEPVSPQPPRPQPVAGQHNDPLADLRGREPSLEELFGLKDRPAPDLAAPEPFPEARSPEGRSPRDVDPLHLLGGPARPVPPATVPDRGPEIFTPFTPPQARPEPVLEARPETPPLPQASAPVPVFAPHPDAPMQPSIPSQPSQPLAAATPSSAGPDEEALLRAFLKGAGIAGGRVPRLTPETMESIGTVLREAVQGTLDLLRARGLTKSELRADVTVVMATDNNPLKFSPTVEAALTHLLALPVPGFMPPVRAMKDAYDDLRAHQLGFLAGMRAALDEVLSRFAPSELEERLSDPSMLDSLLPMNRRAKLWDLFVERYEGVAADAREDFNTAFGKAFLRAYEAQVKQLRAEGRRA